MDEKFFRNVNDAVGNLVDRKTQQPPRFGGQPGEAVPAVDVENLKAAWRLVKDVEALNPVNPTVNFESYKQVCKPGADVKSVWYRTMLLWIMDHMEQLAP